VLITNYNIVVRDESFFHRYYAVVVVVLVMVFFILRKVWACCLTLIGGQRRQKPNGRIKWEFMVLDEAQAIKSASSARWKSLLSFSCRNRLLLTGTPIQNSMAEVLLSFSLSLSLCLLLQCIGWRAGVLAMTVAHDFSTHSLARAQLWALLHFIMPTLFDSHEEFTEWFSKDIESHAENKSALNERTFVAEALPGRKPLTHSLRAADQLSRLHMVLKPFMLRRLKTDIEFEMPKKVRELHPTVSRQPLPPLKKKPS
jgi:DNA helicase INO80